MATLVASPLTSPLGSPTRFLPDFQSEQTETTALVDGLLTAWSAQQSQSASLDQPLHLEEPTSYPFPSLIDGDYAVPEIPTTQALQGVDLADFTSVDFETPFGEPDQDIPLTEDSNHEAFNAMIDFFDDGMTVTPGMLPMSNEPIRDVSAASAGPPDQWTNNTSLFYVNDNVLTVQNMSLEFNYNSANNAHCRPGLEPSNPGTSSQAPPQSTIQPPFQFTAHETFASPFTPSVSKPTPSMLPSTAFEQPYPALADKHYSNTSSSRKRQKVKELPHNNKLQYKDKAGAVIGALITLGNDKALRQPYSAADRAKTKITRQRGACEACRVSKKRCNRPESPYECCDNCKLRVLSMPCFIAKLINADLFRDKPSPKHPRSALRSAIFESLTDISHRPQRPIIVNLTQDLGLQMLVVLARYDPMPGEATHRVWKSQDGQAHHIKMPPYCIANMRDAQQHMQEYITNFRSAFLKHVLGRSNEITRSMFDQAQRFAAFNPDSTVSKALDLCAASRIIERDWRICGSPADLGIPLVSDEASHFFNIVPITPMMDAQLDQIVIHSFLRPVRNVLLNSLQCKIASASNASSFFEVFLTVAVLLSHAEWLLTHSRQSALRVGAKTRYNYIPRAEAYFHACNTIIAYWHHMCRGAGLLEMKWVGLDGEQVQFLEDLKKRINMKESKSMMLRLREENKYESELYWCHQLFFPNWKAGAKAVEDEIMTD